MFDDFKTEFKRLGIKRVQKEEERQQNYALVILDKNDYERDELEFKDELNASRSRLHTMETAAARRVSLGGLTARLRQESVSSDRRGEARSRTEKGGRLISRLPGL